MSLKLLILMVFSITYTTALKSIATPSSRQYQHQNLMKELSQLIAENTQKIRQSESLIQKSILESSHKQQLQPHIEDRKEGLTKQKFLYQLQGKLRTADKNTPIKAVTIKALEQMGIQEALHQMQPNLKFITTMNSIKQALLSLHEPGESIIGFIQSFLNASRFAKPLSVAEFQKMRSYSNSQSFAYINGATPETAGDDIDNELKIIDNIESKIQNLRQASKKKNSLFDDDPNSVY